MIKSALVIAATLVMAALVICPGARAGQGVVSIADVKCRFGGDTLLTGTNIQFVLRYANNTGERVDLSNGFVVQSPDGAQFDSVRIDTTVIDAMGRSVFSQYFNVAFSFPTLTGFAGDPDTVGLLAAGILENVAMLLPDGFSDTVLTITVFAGASTLVSNSFKHICVDTAFFNPGGTWTWMGPTMNWYYPEWVGLPGQSHTPSMGYCYTLYMGCGPNPVASEGEEKATSGCTNCYRCCIGTTGNVNRTGVVDLGDLSALSSYLTGGGWVPRCPEEANVDGTGAIDLSDLSALVSYLTGGGFHLPNCPL